MMYRTGQSDGHQVDALQLIGAGRFNFDLIAGYAGLYQRFFDLLKRMVVLSGFGLGLKQHDGPDIATTLFALLVGQQFEPPLQAKRRVDYFGPLTLLVVDNHRQLHHVLLLQLQGIHKADDVAILARGGRQIKNKGRVEVAQHLYAQVAFGVVALIDHDHRLQRPNDVDDGRFVDAFQHVRVGGLSRREADVIAVLLEQFAVFLILGPERIETHDNDAQLPLHGGGVEASATQQGLLVEYFDAVLKMGVDFLPIGVIGIAQILNCLLQNGIGGHQPDDNVGR